MIFSYQIVFRYKHSYKRLDLLSLTAAQTQTIYCLTLWGNNGFNSFTSRCSPVIIAHLDAFVWLNGIFGWLDQHGAVAAQFSSHLSGSISGAATWRRADWRLQTDSWKQMSWGGGERSRDGGSFRGSVWIRAVILDYRPFNVPPTRFIFSPLLEVVMTILNSFHGERLSPSHFAIIFTGMTAWWGKKGPSWPLILSAGITEFLTFGGFLSVLVGGWGWGQECSTAHERAAAIQTVQLKPSQATRCNIEMK